MGCSPSLFTSSLQTYPWNHILDATYPNSLSSLSHPVSLSMSCTWMGMLFSFPKKKLIIEAQAGGQTIWILELNQQNLLQTKRQLGKIQVMFMHQNVGSKLSMGKKIN